MMFGEHMFEKLDKEEFRYFLVNSREAISYILDILNDKDALDILVYLHYESSTFKKLNAFFDKLDKDTVSKYVAKMWDIGILEYTEKQEFKLTKLGEKFLQITVQFVIEALLSDEVKDEKMQKILIQRIAVDELAQFKKEREENRAKGIQLGLFRGP